jgi:hypothetical protein
VLARFVYRESTASHSDQVTFGLLETDPGEDFAGVDLADGLGPPVVEQDVHAVRGQGIPCFDGKGGSIVHAPRRVPDQGEDRPMLLDQPDKQLLVKIPVEVLDSLVLKKDDFVRPLLNLIDKGLIFSAKEHRRQRV